MPFIFDNSVKSVISKSPIIVNIIHNTSIKLGIFFLIIDTAINIITG